MKNIKWWLWHITEVETEERILVSHIRFTVGKSGSIWREEDKIVPSVTREKKVHYGKILF